ncbi:hypothetical protein B0H66DRAFT_550528 [Apodospora peruviana]|uniref:GST N-terminal domain-containing protein n=1 Tax=Apodospora peruviana TaxID=516989 RepID=A0AAE0IJG8_9PEZI|nr:hypothetical protein B0H66DRAFT_550528 [Apodospora peruviana]
MVYHLYITNKNYSSWSLRPWLLMRVLGIPFDEHLVPIISGSISQPHWKSFSPVAHVPCLHDSSLSEEQSIILWESIAIVEHLAEAISDKHIYPVPERKAARAWARSAVAEMHAGFGAIRNEMSMNIGLRIQLNVTKISGGLRRDLERIGELWTEGLEKFGGPYLAGGEFTAVDAFYAPIVLRMQTFVGSMDLLGEKSKQYVDMMLGLPEMVEWVGDALKETGRDVLHDEDSIGGRKVLADLRAKEE